MIKIYNSLTKKKESLRPVMPGKIGIYVCGITAYDYSHIGHARSSIVFDVVVRYLRYRGYEVTYVHNITDVDDKIIKRANENNESCEALTERFIQAMHDDEKALGILPPDYEPRATEYMPQIIKLIQAIIDEGYAYVGENGDIYFDVRRFKEYGKLSQRNIDELIAGARVEIGEAKRDPLDFALWKLAKPEEPNWDSPWGKGRPGWHIECSAMSTALLGQPFDIHGGGMDLKFPHHENEIAQSEAACRKDFAHIWMHVGLLQVNKEKMSKSLGNFFTVREIIAEHHPEILRYFMLSGHYRSPVNYSKENFTQMRASLERLYLALRGLPQASVGHHEVHQRRFQAAMDDDFNTPEALSVLFDMAHEINRLREANQLEEAAQLGATLKNLGSLFGILEQNPETFFRGDVHNNEREKIDKMIAARDRARKNKDWTEADRLRTELIKMGVVIEDTADGTIWRREL